MSKRIAILQSSYIPWKGYFDLIAAVDEFVIYDEVQFTTRDWRSRNRIKTQQGLQWLTVPVRQSGRPPICEVALDGDKWRDKHWRSLVHSYRKARHFDDTAAWLEPLYHGPPFEMLSEVNLAFIRAICGQLGIGTVISDSRQYAGPGDPSERLANICSAAGADTYLSGPAAQAYLQPEPFDRQGIAVRWFDYDGYPEYDQLWGAFEHSVSVLDLFFHCGPKAASYLRYTA